MACSKEKVEVHRGEMASAKRSDAWFGCNLVRTVYDKLVESSSKNKLSAWSVNEAVNKQHIMKYAEGKRAGMSKANWTIPKVSENTRKKNAILIKPVKADPLMNYWVKTPVNIPTPDSKFLSNIPFLGDDHKNNTFTDKLFENYGYNVHDDEAYDDIPIQSEVTIDLIRVLMEIGDQFGEEVFSSEPNPTIQKPSLADLREIVNKVITANEKAYAKWKPSPTIFAAVCEAFEGVEPSKLHERYIQLSKRRDPSFDCVKNAPLNVDKGNDTKVRTKKTQMDSFASLFCRLCFKYACVQHVLLNSEEIIAMQEVAKLQRIENEKLKVLAKKPSVKTAPPQEAITCTFQNCCKEIDEDEDQLEDLCEQEVKKRWRKHLSESEWTATERTMFNCMYGSFEDYCIVASMLKTKTCIEVMNYHRLLKLMKGNSLLLETQPPSKKVKITASSSSSKLTDAASGYDSSNSASSQGVEDVPDNAAELYTYAPCCHKDGICGDSCLCVAEKKFCETPCGCLKSCKNRFKGCVCTTTCDSKRCPCFCANRECDPDLCQRCCSHEIDIKKVTCKNVSVQRKLKSPIELKPSLVSGWGAFASAFLKKGDYIGEYTAELISDIEADRRGHIYDEKSHTYLFTLVENHLVLDAARLGSECRFINSSKKPNCQVRNTTVRGENHLAIVASRDIDKGTELFINYHQVLDYCKMKKLTQKNKKYI